jgi:hypothetical protein
MGRFAHVRSIDAVEAMRAALARFHEDACAALEEIDMQIHRATEWVHEDRKDFWNHEVHRDWDLVSEARVNLEKARTFKRVADHRPSCDEEKKALQRAKRRLQIAQEKVEIVRRWGYAVDRAVNEYVGSVSPLRRWLESDFHRAFAALKRIGQALDSYVTTAPPPTTEHGALSAVDQKQPMVDDRPAASADRQPEQQEPKPANVAEPTEAEAPSDNSGPEQLRKKREDERR